jgi:hypothetical protein
MRNVTAITPKSWPSCRRPLQIGRGNVLQHRRILYKPNDVNELRAVARIVLGLEQQTTLNGVPAMRLTTKTLTTLAAIAGAGLCGTANAGPIPMTWTDFKDFTPDRKVTTHSPAIFTHHLSDFNKYTDEVFSYSLTFNLYDDYDKDYEKAVFSQPGALMDEVWFNLSGTESGGWTLAGVWQLEHTGTLTVAITALVGDFYLGASTLRVRGERNGGHNAVTEPGTLALLGASLLGFGLMRRKRNVA